MARTKKFSVKNVEKALIASGGFKSEAARGLSCSTKTVYNYINKNEKLQDLIWDIEEQYLDLAESNIIKRLRDGDFEATKFYLERKGRSRGYSKQEMPNKDKIIPIPQPVNILNQQTNAEITREDFTKAIEFAEAAGLPKEEIEEAKRLRDELAQ